MKKQDFTVEVPGQGEFDVTVDRLAGIVVRRKTIVLESELEGVEALDTAIHEYLHALEPTWSEKRVARSASGMAKYLWKIGVRV